MIILAIDPGTEQSAEVLYSPDGAISRLGGEPSLVWGRLWHNDQLLERLRIDSDPINGIVVCEMVQHYGSGLAVGKETFETVRWIGRFQEAVEARGGRFEILYRPAIKAHLCGSAKAKDGNVRQALIDRFGGDSVALKGKACPSKRFATNEEGNFRVHHPDCPKCDGSGWLRKPGPLAGITSHMWAALAVAVTWAETQGRVAKREPIELLPVPPGVGVRPQYSDDHGWPEGTFDEPSEEWERKGGTNAS